MGYLRGQINQIIDKLYWVCWGLYWKESESFDFKWEYSLDAVTYINLVLFWIWLDGTHTIADNDDGDDCIICIVLLLDVDQSGANDELMSVWSVRYNYVRAGELTVEQWTKLRPVKELRPVEELRPCPAPVFVIDFLSVVRSLGHQTDRHADWQRDQSTFEKFRILILILTSANTRTLVTKAL